MEIVQKYKNSNAVLICKLYKIYELKRQNLMLKIKNYNKIIQKINSF